MWKKLLAGAVTAAVLGAGGIAVAGAVSSPSTSTPKSTDAAPQGASDGARAARGLKLLGAAGRVAAKTIGISPEQLRQEVRAGKTVGEVATAHGASPQAVVDALVKAADARIATAKAAGKITDAQATRLHDKAAAFADRFANRTQELASNLRKRARRSLGGAGLATAARLIGISPDQLRTELQRGKSVADVATAEGKDVATLERQLVAAATKRIDRAVADGKLARVKAARLKQALPKIVDRRVRRAGGARAGAGASANPDA